jgi:hypothetical protein
MGDAIPYLLLVVGAPFLLGALVGRRLILAIVLALWTGIILFAAVSGEFSHSTQDTPLTLLLMSIAFGLLPALVAAGLGVWLSVRHRSR